MLDLTGSNLQVHIVPTVRERDGLAMSSRNMRLNSGERERASAIYQALQFMKANLAEGSLVQLKEEAGNMLVERGFRPDYVEIAGADNLEIVSSWDGKKKLVGAVAAFLNEVRLIDNMPFN